MHAQEVVECIRRKGGDDILRHIELATAVKQRLTSKKEDEEAKVALAKLYRTSAYGGRSE